MIHEEDARARERACVRLGIEAMREVCAKAHGLRGLRVH